MRYCGRFDHAYHRRPRSEEHTSELQSLSLHDALPICHLVVAGDAVTTAHRIMSSEFLFRCGIAGDLIMHITDVPDRKSTRLNSSHFPYTTLFRSVIWWLPAML